MTSPTPIPIRLLTAVPICDGHDSAINTINLELIRHGIEVVYLGYHRPASEIVRAAVQEDVRAIGLSSYNGGHVEFFAEVRAQLDALGARHIGLFGGGGGHDHGGRRRNDGSAGHRPHLLRGHAAARHARLDRRALRQATGDDGASDAADLALARRLTDAEERVFQARGRSAGGS